MSVRSVNSRRVVVLLVALAVLTGMVLWTAPAVAAKKRVPLDHFWCYPVAHVDQPPPDQPPPEGIKVELQDQFDIPGNVMVAWVYDPVWFCNPVEKKHKKRVYEITNGEGHLTFYWIETDDAPDRVIKYRNQFRRGRAVLGQPVMLAVPTAKAVAGTPPPGDVPRGLDHFKCYEVLEAKPAKRRVALADQWQKDKVRVGDAKLFCNPTRKIHGDNVVGVTNARGHLMCYVTEPVGDDHFTASIFNQFGEYVLPLEDAQVLCVPTLKHRKWRTLD